MKKIEDLVKQYYQNLPQRLRNWLKNKRGLSDEVIDKFKLGWDGKALTIPIYDKKNQYIFFKYRKDPQDNSAFSKYWYSPNSTAEFYGWEHIVNPKPTLILCEGELDRLLLETYSLPAITSTSGVGTFKDEWIEILNSLPSEIFICYDNDNAGMDGAERILKRIPEAKVIQIPRLEDIKDITDFIITQGIDEFRKLLKEAKTWEEIIEEVTIYEKTMKGFIYPPLSLEELLKVVGLTVKQDEVNKLITFLCCLSAYTENSQFNISFNAPSSTGKSYIPIEIASLFPKEDVIKVGYCSPTAFFHDKGKFLKELEGYYVDLERKILIFLDQPHTLLLQHLRPLLSHDDKEIKIKITDKSQKYGLKTKNIVIRGFPSVIFCSAGLTIDEQEATRFLLLSPEVSQDKIKEGILEAIKKEKDLDAYLKELNNNPQRQHLIERIKAIQEERVREIKIHNPQEIEQRFFSEYKVLKPRHQRDIKRLISLIKSLALLNLWHRETENSNIILTSDKDIEEGFKIWREISLSQELNLSPYVYSIFSDVILPLYQKKQEGLSRKEIMQEYVRVYNRPTADWLLRQQIIPMLETAGLITQEPDSNDRRKMLIYPTVSLTISQEEIYSE